MLCVQSAPRKVNYTLAILKCDVVITSLEKFLEEGRPIPYARADLPGDPFFWGFWVFDGNVRIARIGASEEEFTFYETVLSRILKPFTEYRELFLDARGRRSTMWQQCAARALLIYFSELAKKLNEADVQQEINDWRAVE